MTNLVPAKIAPYLKFAVGLAGAIVTSLLVALPQPPHWLAIVSSVVTAVSVYFVPNDNGDKEAAK